MKNSPAPSFLGHPHDHEACVRQAMARAEHICQGNDLRLTRIRRRILELLWASHRPAPAYDLLKRLRREKANAEPPTVYRALDFLVENGIAHKIRSLNAYVGCPNPGQRHTCQFLICTGCDEVAELNNSDIGAAITRNAMQNHGFKTQHQTVEVMGLCPSCQDND